MRRHLRKAAHTTWVWIRTAPGTYLWLAALLVTGASWTDGGGPLPYAVLYTVFHAPAEHWLGTRRWLATAAAALVGATLSSEGALSWAVHQGHAHEAAGDSLAIGVSYALAGVVAVLTYRIAPPWRLPYGGAVVILYGVPLIAGPDFTDIGHFTAVLIGLACYPLTRGRTRTPDLDTSAKRGVRTPS
ncbi:rhomboid-like protein [Streptomyces sp. NPDC057137]|uniref:rhomboid-like protein n=1 Tax=Streptomyces sp. NPDC057137 TaxID=3346030 RepID=UPI0036425E82